MVDGWEIKSRVFARDASNESALEEIGAVWIVISSHGESHALEGRERIWIFYPPTDHNLALLAENLGDVGRLAKLSSQLTGGFITLVDHTKVVYIPPGWIRATFTTNKLKRDERCSTHVDVGMQTWTLKNLKRVAKTILLLEEAIRFSMPENRRYCMWAAPNAAQKYDPEMVMGIELVRLYREAVREENFEDIFEFVDRAKDLDDLIARVAPDRCSSWNFQHLRLQCNLEGKGSRIRRGGLIIGPPGSGKTLTSARIVLEWHRQDTPVLVVCASNFGLDVIAKRIAMELEIEEVIISNFKKTIENEPAGPPVIILRTLSLANISHYTGLISP